MEWLAEDVWPKFRWETVPGNMPVNAQNFSCLPGLASSSLGGVMIPRALLQASGSLTASEVVTVILVAKLVTRCLRRRLPISVGRQSQ
jgi:hypothetical protein